VRRRHSPSPALLTPPRSFHKHRCAAGWLTGLGARTSDFFVAACSRAGALPTAVSAFRRGPALGLASSTPIAVHLLSAAGRQPDGAALALASYRALRGAGLQVTPPVVRSLLKALQAPSAGGHPRRALAAARAFVKAGPAPSRRAWNSLAAAAVAAADPALLPDILRDMAAAGVPINQVAHVSVCAAALLTANEAAAAAALGAALAAAAPLAAASELGLTVQQVVAELLTNWATALPRAERGLRTPGGTAGLAERFQRVVATAPGVAVDVGRLLEGVCLGDGPATGLPYVAGPPDVTEEGKEGQ